MNWEAISAVGELLSSFAVVVTLIYLVRQIRSAEVATLNSTQSSIQLARLSVNSQRFDHLDLILRANKGEALTELESAQLRILFENEHSAMFFTYLSFRRAGMDGVAQARNFARFLMLNKAMRDMCRLEFEDWPAQNEPTRDWRESVEKHLALLLERGPHGESA